MIDKQKNVRKSKIGNIEVYPRKTIRELKKASLRRGKSILTQFILTMTFFYLAGGNSLGFLLALMFWLFRIIWWVIQSPVGLSDSEIRKKFKVL